MVGERYHRYPLPTMWDELSVCLCSTLPEIPEKRRGAQDAFVSGHAQYHFPVATYGGNNAEYSICIHLSLPPTNNSTHSKSSELAFPNFVAEAILCHGKLPEEKG